jgi:hypothetical protein
MLRIKRQNNFRRFSEAFDQLAIAPAIIVISSQEKDIQCDAFCAGVMELPNHVGIFRTIDRLGRIATVDDHQVLGRAQVRFEKELIEKQIDRLGEFLGGRRLVQDRLDHENGNQAARQTQKNEL